MKKILKDWFTGIDGITYDIGRLLWAIGVLVFLGLAIIDIIMNHRFSPIEYGTGLGATLAGGGVALKFKKATEPKVADDNSIKQH